MAALPDFWLARAKGLTLLGGGPLVNVLKHIMGHDPLCPRTVDFSEADAGLETDSDSSSSGAA